MNQQIANPVTQNEEYVAAAEFAQATRALLMSHVSNDDYPLVRQRYENTLAALLAACKANGRAV